MRSIQISQRINGKKDWKYSGLPRLNRFAKHSLIAPGLPNVYPPVEMVSIVAVASKATTGTMYLELAREKGETVEAV